MNGAEALLHTLLANNVDVCFTNPGTSEMHFVAALDAVPQMRGVLALFEGVATGAADGFARMTDRPACTLLHLGPGLGNGLANLHNARKGRVPVVNIVGDHTTYHRRFDTQLQSDIETVARNVSPWVRSPSVSADVGRVAAEAVRAALGPPGGVATLVLPADVSWSDGGRPSGPMPWPAPRKVDPSAVDAAAKALRSGLPTTLLLGGGALRKAPLLAAAKVAAGTGAQVLAETFPTRVERGAGIPEVTRLAYLGEFAASQLSGLKNLVLVGATPPASFFAYPGKPSYLLPDTCDVVTLAGAEDDAGKALGSLAELLGVTRVEPRVAGPGRPKAPTGSLTAESIAQAVGALLPEGAIVADEAQTSGLWLVANTSGCPPHDWLTNTGGSIGHGPPVATGAAVACPDRRVLNMQGDGSAMYTLQALWTQAREGLDVTTVILNNRSYAILNLELGRVGAEANGPRARAMLDLHNPDIDFVSVSQGLGVPATRATTADEFTTQLAASLGEPGPSLIEAVVPSIV